MSADAVQVNDDAPDLRVVNDRLDRDWLYERRTEGRESEDCSVTTTTSRTGKKRDRG